MGMDKAALEFGGQSLLERLIRTVSPLVNQIVVMLAADQRLPEISGDISRLIRIGRDSLPCEGPLQGIADALPLLDDDQDPLFVLSCDLPFLTADALEKMRNRLSLDVDGVCAEVDGKTNPLLAVYHRRLLAEVVLPSAAGRTCMVLIDDHRIVPFPPPVDYPLVFNDINTPASFEEAKKLLS